MTSTQKRTTDISLCETIEWIIWDRLAVWYDGFQVLLDIFTRSSVPGYIYICGRVTDQQAWVHLRLLMEVSSSWWCVLWLLVSRIVTQGHEGSYTALELTLVTLVVEDAQWLTVLPPYWKQCVWPPFRDEHTAYWNWFLWYVMPTPVRPWQGWPRSLAVCCFLSVSSGKFLRGFTWNIQTFLAYVLANMFVLGQRQCRLLLCQHK